MMTSWASLLTVSDPGAGLTLGGARHSIDLWTLLTLLLSLLVTVLTHRTAQTSVSDGVMECALGTGNTGAVNDHGAAGAGEGLADVHTGCVQDGAWQYIIHTQTALIKDNVLQQSLNPLASSVIDVDCVRAIQGGERDLEIVLLVHIVHLSLDLAAGLLDTGNIDIQTLTLLLTNLVTSRESPLIIEALESCDDLLLEVVLTSLAAQDLGQVLELDLEDLLSRCGGGAGGIHKLRGGVLVRVWSPESLGATSVELRHGLRELLTVGAANLANLEDAARSPVLTGLSATLRCLQWRT